MIISGKDVNIILIACVLGLSVETYLTSQVATSLPGIEVLQPGDKSA